MSEREQEKLNLGEMFTLPLPDADKRLATRERPIEEKTALWVPLDKIQPCGFRPSETWPEVLVSDDVIGVLRVVGRMGRISSRSELENDPNKQQVIFYTAVVYGDDLGKKHLLWYQRATPEATNLPSELLGDERLRGRYSIGVGGHKTKDDILSAGTEMDFLGIMAPGLTDEMSIWLGANKGLLKEVEEEIGVGPLDLRNRPRVLGAFMDRRASPGLKTGSVPVGHVHLALPTVIELSPSNAALRFFRREIAWAEWSPLEDAEVKLTEYMTTPYGADSWTEVYIKEFLRVVK